MRIYIATEAAQRDGFIACRESVRQHAPDAEVVVLGDEFGEDWNKGGWATGFTCYRWAVPELAKFEGRALYMDTDVMLLRDPSPIFDWPMEGHALLSRKPDMGVALFDCERFQAPEWPSVDAMRRAHHDGRGCHMAMLGQIAGRLGHGMLPAGAVSLDGDGDPRSATFLHFTSLWSQPWRPFEGQREYRDHPSQVAEAMFWGFHEAGKSRQEAGA